MTRAGTCAFPHLEQLPESMPRDGAISITLEEGVPVFRASTAVLARIEALLRKQRTTGLAAKEEEELDRYEEIDDYLSHLNRVVRNLLQTN
ncbi:MAG: hypothetical protein L0332_33910 [Chloroflexi bacterium]|nr:hypothetical protein [Chloroflexota bacterium]MCI0574627.1 hypothetical protein [Chloroflexota bacterium]MCI0644021.1 hypothetical protein [Chloroflexota bacterium]MCI0731695.1 hypothetical protein [Chloroflexota bacterium]